MSNDASFQAPYIPADEKERLEELHGLKLLDSAAELRFDRYTRLIADIFSFPAVLVTLVDRDREWVKSAHGWDKKEISRDLSFCAHAISQPDVLVVPDALLDPRFAGNPLVTGQPHIRFYAGAQVHGPTGKPLGALCVIDYEPRHFDDDQCRRLRAFADLIESEIRHSYDLEQVRASVEFSAYYDPLTKLPNRRLLTDRLHQLLALAQREERQLAVLLFNVAGLRLLNQSLGTKTGDDLLQQLGERLLSCCPSGGTVARLQADEFVLTFLSFRKETGHIDAVADLARSELEKPFAFADVGTEHYLRVRIGGSIFPEHGRTPEALIEKASAAIRFVGEGEPGAIRFFSKSESVSISERLHIESALRGALEKQQLTLQYQPIVSLDTGRLAALEALLRWSDPELGEIPPDHFIPIAEQTGLIVPIGRWVQEQVCEQIKHWHTESGWDIPVAINVAAAELLQQEFAQDLLNQMEQAGLSPGLLSIEVTESSLVSDSPLVDQNLALLDKISVRINIDDFGTGYSSLAYLRRMPISSLKIDRSFVHGVPASKHGVALTQTIISMAQTLGLGIVAEGVESDEQLTYLRQAHCQYGQGFLISRPCNADQVPSLCGRRLI